MSALKELGAGVLAASAVGAVSVTAGVVVPTLVSTGHGTETAAVSGAVLVVYILYKFIWGDDEANAYLEQQQEVAEAKDTR